MPTTFNVFFLGVFADIDPDEGDNTAENAGLLVGQTFGSQGNALLNNAQLLSAVSFSGGNPTAYDMNNLTSNDTFSINGGLPQTYDGSAVYNATITYVDGTTATITAVIIQDSAGNTYWVPEFAPNADQAAMEAKPIRSLTIDGVNGDTFSGTNADRQFWNFLLCYTAGTNILTPDGDRPVEALQPGDLIMTRDHGPQPIRWIGSSTARAHGNLAPIRIASRALGNGLPQRDLLVSRQHRMLLASRIVERMLGAPEVLVPAIKLLGLPGVDLIEDGREVAYFHILTDRHEIIFAEGARSETLLTGPETRKLLGPDGVAELEALFPGLVDAVSVPARPVLHSARVDRIIERHLKNAVSLT